MVREREGEREGSRGQHEESPRVAAERKSKKELHRAAESLKLESTPIPKKQHLTATPVSAFKSTVSHHPPIPLLLCCRGRALTHR